MLLPLFPDLSETGSTNCVYLCCISGYSPTFADVTGTITVKPLSETRFAYRCRARYTPRRMTAPPRILVAVRLSPSSNTPEATPTRFIRYW